MPTETLMMKDSKIDWIGYIPQEWNVKKIKYCAYLKTGTTPDGNDGIVDEDSDYNWYTPGDFVDNYILQLSERNILKNAVKKYHIKLYSPGSVLMVCIGATVGKIGYIDKYAYSNQQITALMPKKNIIGKFLLYLLSAMTKYMNENAQYTTLPIINNTYLSSINIVLPNRIEEQQAIADFLDEKCEKIDKVIGEIEEQIQVLEDYKKSLITETVTKGLDKNADVNIEELVKKTSAPDKLLKEKLLKKLQWGLMTIVLSIGLFIYAIFVGDAGELKLYVIGSVVLLAIGVSLLFTYLMGKKMLAKEMEAEEQNLRQS